jgi:hypothetical protein
MIWEVASRWWKYLFDERKGYDEWLWLLALAKFDAPFVQL